MHFLVGAIQYPPEVDIVAIFKMMKQALGSAIATVTAVESYLNLSSAFFLQGSSCLLSC